MEYWVLVLFLFFKFLHFMVITKIFQMQKSEIPQWQILLSFLQHSSTPALQYSNSRLTFKNLLNS